MAELPLALQGSRYDRRLRGEHALHLGCQIGDPAVTSVFVGAFNQPTRTTTTKVRIACEHPVADPAPTSGPERQPALAFKRPLSRSPYRSLHAENVGAIGRTRPPSLPFCLLALYATSAGCRGPLEQHSACRFDG